MAQIEYQILRTQEKIERDLDRIADSLEDLLRIHKRTQHCYVVHPDETFNATIDITKEETENDR